MKESPVYTSLNGIIRMLLITLASLAWSIPVCIGQESLSLADCYALAERNYPLSKQSGLIAKTAEYTIENIMKGTLPQLNFNGQASYQSAVTAVPLSLPGMNIPVPDKDQYKLYGEVSQIIYDGGAINHQKELQESRSVIEEQKLKAELYALKSRINDLFFGILLADEQLKQNELLIKDLELGLSKVRALINNGTALKSNADVLQADLLKTRQRSIEIRASRKAYSDMLAVFLGKETGDDLMLIKPRPVAASTRISRPELRVFEEQDISLGIQDKLLATKALPKLGFFFQGGIGRPALNMLSNQFDAYYIGGLRLSWSPSVFYTLKNDRALIDINRSSLEVQKQTFLFNTGLAIKQESAGITKFMELLASDDEIIALREKVKKTSVVQLENGVINANDYLREANAEDQARQARILHEIQLLISQYKQQTTSGNL